MRAFVVDDCGLMLRCIRGSYLPEPPHPRPSLTVADGLRSARTAPQCEPFSLLTMEVLYQLSQEGVPMQCSPGNLWAFERR